MKWRRENPDKDRESGRRYSALHAEELKKKRREYYLANREIVLAKRKEYLANRTPEQKHRDLETQRRVWFRKLEENKQKARERRDRRSKNCADCGTKISFEGTYCKKCMFLKERQYSWKGEISDTYRGRNKRQLHRIVMEEKIGRALKKKEMVHHVNKVRGDNRPENLLLFRKCSAHNRWHGFLRRHGLENFSFSQPWLAPEGI